MSILCDTSIIYEVEHIKGLGIDPFTRENVGPCSVDLCLGDTMVVPRFGETVDVSCPDVRYDEVFCGDTGHMVLEPSVLTLVSTVERVRIPSYMRGKVEGRSTLGRLGLLIHLTAGFIDAGFEGDITLEMINMLPVPVSLPVGMRVCQLELAYLTGPAKRPYGSKGLGSSYQWQTGPTPARGAGR